jgi:hypothetical protein
VGSAHGSISELALTEPTAGGWFRTSIATAASLDSLAVSVNLAAGSSILTPLSLDVHCPRIVRDVLALPVTWTYGTTPLTSNPVIFNGAAGGDAFITLAWSPERSVPVIAMSDEHGTVLHPGIVEALAADVAGLAVVARLDPGASWRLTARKGKEWSCYGGAIRLYWPGLDATASPYAHPLWTPLRLLEGVADTETAAGKIRSQLRRRILSQSAFAISESQLFSRVRRAAREEELKAFEAKARVDADLEGLVESYLHELAKAEAGIQARDEEIAALKAQVSSLQLALRWKDAELDAVEPDPETPPSSVEEAVLIAMEKFGSTLIFGPSVNDGIKGVAPDAGPPDKVLSYLGTLAELTEARRKGPLGTTAIKWLEAKGVIASGESETIRNSAKERQARTWDDGAGAKRYFELHLKPSEATSPDRCVRIYFEYDEKRAKAVIGWVGKHP